MEHGSATPYVSTLPPVLSLTIRKFYILQEYEVTLKKVKNKTAFSKETVGCLHLIILGRKSDDGPLPHCKTGAELEGNNQPGPLVSHSLSYIGQERTTAIGKIIENGGTAASEVGSAKHSLQTVNQTIVYYLKLP
jgi:hypothetical protein